MEPMFEQSRVARKAAFGWIRRTAPAWVCLGVLLALTLGPNPARPQLFADQDLAEHLIAFFAVSFLFGLGGSLVSALVIGLGLGACAIGIEYFQAVFQPTRQASLDDALAGFVGIGLGLAFALIAGWSFSQIAFGRERTRRAT